MPALAGLLAHLVVFVGGPLHVVHGRVLRTVEAGHQHLRQADVLGPGNAARLILSQFLDAEVGADALDARVAQNPAQLGALVFGEAAESGVGVTYRRAQLDRLKSGVGKLLMVPGKSCAIIFRTGQV